MIELARTIAICAFACGGAYAGIRFGLQQNSKEHKLYDRKHELYEQKFHAIENRQNEAEKNAAIATVLLKQLKEWQLIMEESVKTLCSDVAKLVAIAESKNNDK